ncbi:MAG: maleylacetoacetate isomerase [Bdellovibrionales bacterium]|nr:maleylacetoacetate isomerase [Bdellovibrionales bacterium]
MGQIILHNYFRSSTSYRVRIALHYKNLEYTYKPVHLLNNGGEQHQKSYLELNPMAEVPTLEHKGFYIGQSMAITEYLEEAFPNPPLLPKDIQQRARIRQFCESINSFLHPISNLKVLKYLEEKHQYDPSQKIEWVNHWYQKGLLALETWLKKNSKEYSFGNDITYADCFLVPLVFTAKRFNVDMKNYSLINKINENCLKLDCFKKAHPFNQIDTPEQKRTTL